MVKGIIFDCDGVLHNAVDCDYKTWCRLFREEFEVDLPWDTYHNAAGGSGADFIVKNAPRRVSADEARALFAKQGTYFAAQIKEDCVREPEGLSDLLRNLHALNVKMSVATSGNVEKAGGVIDYFGFRKYFPHLVTVHEVPRAKPYPDLFLEAMRRMELRPDECAIIEDSPSGIRAALASEAALVIGITSTHSREVLEKLNPHMLIGSFKDLNADYVRSYQRN